jgi:hypothetical protein
MRRTILFYAPVATALIMAIVNSRWLFVGSGLTLIPWALITLVWGFTSTDARMARRQGAVYGFFQSFLFLWIDKSGHLGFGQFIALVCIIFSLSMLAAICAAIGARLAFALKKRVLQ